MVADSASGFKTSDQSSGKNLVNVGHFWGHSWEWNASWRFCGAHELSFRPAL